MDIQGMSLFRVARERDWDWTAVLDCSEAVNPLGPAPGVRGAIVEALDRIAHYPEPSPQVLLDTLARRWQVAPEQVLLGNGATELIHFTARQWRKENATLAVPLYPEFHRAHPAAPTVQWNEPHRWPEQGLFIFAQPNNPIGQTLPFGRVREYLLRTVNPVIVDESFIEFTDSPSAISLIGRRPNLFVLRSLTAFYALPGLRIGALVGDAGNLAALRERREPWQVNVLAEAAALASLRDLDHSARSKSLVAAEREWLWDQLSRIPTLTPVRGEANFLLVYLTQGAAGMIRFLEDHKVLVRDCTGWPGVEGEAIRVTVRTRPENERLAGLLRRYICG